MKKALLLVVIFSGLSVLSTNIFREYHYVKLNKTWTDAQKYCREKFTDLATVENQDENKRLLSVIQPKKWAFIGLYDDIIKWKWVHGNVDLNHNSDFSNWKDTEPNNHGSKQHCVVMNKDGLWRDANCQGKRPAVCFYEKGPSRYILVMSLMTWNESKNYCRSNYTDLASVRNKSENDEIRSLLSELTWIGLHRDFWSYWSDQTPATFTNWNLSQPDGDARASCTLINPSSGKWFDGLCSKQRYFICEKVLYPQRRTTFKLRFQSEADLNDPDIQHQILKQLHAKLDTNGFPESKLCWTQRDGRAFHKELKKDKEPGSGC